MSLFGRAQVQIARPSAQDEAIVVRLEVATRYRIATLQRTLKV
jgi:hypothetical protein